MLNNIQSSIELFKNKKSYSNNASRYLPIGPDVPKDQNLNWPLVYKSIYEKVLGLELAIETTDQLFESILDDMSSQRKTRELKNLVDEVYLNEASLSLFSPYLQLICNDKPKARTKTAISIFGSMLSGMEPASIDFSGVNFVEELINNCIKNRCNENSGQITDHSYLPFMADLFKNDIKLLSSNANWLSEDFSHFIELYTFLYLTQLSVHLGSINSRFTQPQSREVFFILETEKASKERHECNIKGYKSILANHNGLGLDVFSHLGYLELLSELPIWQLTNSNIPSQYIDNINELNELICSKFEIDFNGRRASIEESINDGLYYHKQLFKKSSKTSTRSDANDKIVTTFKDVFAKNFKSDRKSAGGWYFQLSTKTALLITNLIIGKEKKLLIDDVIEGFRKRGIYFDLKTKRSLLKIYENIGNIEKLSDSGDAVYVKSTI
ncbi:DNA phosphorothioation-dependent restriction protein DptG [Neptuniibacter sp. PT8_73]|uniref:DNA phosphorothioation-dependent restriction protein DptG n=1 Tax=Neptuniibacter sp. PT8_73 TaxID=3398206 RepID=UPI0039F6330B